MTVLSVRNLNVAYQLPDKTGQVEVLRDVSFDVEERQIVAIVGESGSGKSTLIKAVTGSLARNATVQVERLSLGGRDLPELSRSEFTQIRGGEIGSIPQDAVQGLNPLVPVGRLAAEPLRKRGVSKGARRRTILELFERVGLADPERVYKSHAHELSGGMCQRVLIAAAVSTRPRLLVADEPTSALDVTIQKRILDLLVELRAEISCGIILVTHDLGVAEERADHLHVISRGRIVESGTPAGLLADPHNEYTKQLFASSTVGTAVVEETRVGAAGESDSPVEARPLVQVSQLSKTFPGSRSGADGRPALAEVSFDVLSGTTLGIVGESGSGKSTLLRIVAGLVHDYQGSVRVDLGDRLADIGAKESRDFMRRRTQFIYQDSYSALDPRLSIERILAEPLTGFKLGDKPWRKRRVDELLDLVRLPHGVKAKYSSEISGGQRQRVAIARSLAAEPRLLLADEPVSALDVTVQAQILSLLREIQAELGFTTLFVSHDLGVIADIAESTLVLLQGQVVEFGRTHDVLTNSAVPYVKELVDAIPGGHLVQR